MPATAPTDFALTPLLERGHTSRELLAASARPFQGTAAGITATGHARALVAGDPLLGFAEQTLNTEDVRATAGAQSLNFRTGLMLAETGLAGSLLDVLARRNVYLSDDNAFSFTANGNTPCGHVVGLTPAGTAVALITPHRFRHDAPGASGVRTLAATGDETLTLADLNKVILLPNTAAKTITLPPVLRCAGKTVTFKKTTAAAFANTLDGNESETIDGATTNAAIDAQWDMLSLYCDGTQWLIVSRLIA